MNTTTPTATEIAAAAATHRDGTCFCDSVNCSEGHVGAEQGHCECGEPSLRIVRAILRSEAVSA